MCTTVFIRDTKTPCETVAELSEAIGAANIAWHEAIPEAAAIPDHCCLCPVDVEATFSRLGYQVGSGWDDLDNGADYAVWQ